jgi:carboxypeptidase family protein
VSDSAFAAGDIGFKTRNQSGFDNVVVTAAGAPTPTPTATSTPTPVPGSTPTPTATPIPAGTGVISGQVTDAISGAPIAGAQVSTVPASSVVTTDANGNYALQNLGSATYDVVVTASGYNENHTPNIGVTNGTTTTANVALQGIPGYAIMDTFTQPDQPGWNPSTDGHTWTDDASVYPGASVSVQNNLGYAGTYVAATDRDEWMSVNYSDQLVSADFNVSQFGQDAYQHGPRLLGRVQDGHNFIDFAINYATSTLQIWVNKGENWTMMKQVSVPAFKTNQWYHARLLTVGSMSYGKVWAYNTPEPGWMISGSQTLLTTGSGGVRSTFADIYWANYSTQAVTTIVGVVSNSSGGAIAGATVSDGQNSVTTDASGRYVLIEPNVRATYTVAASASGYTTQSASVTSTSLTSTTQNFTLQ